MTQSGSMTRTFKLDVMRSYSEGEPICITYLVNIKHNSLADIKMLGKTSGGSPGRSQAYKLRVTKDDTYSYIDVFVDIYSGGTSPGDETSAYFVYLYDFHICSTIENTVSEFNNITVYNPVQVMAEAPSGETVIATFNIKNTTGAINEDFSITHFSSYVDILQVNAVRLVASIGNEQEGSSELRALIGCPISKNYVTCGCEIVDNTKDAHGVSGILRFTAAPDINNYTDYDMYEKYVKITNGTVVFESAWVPLEPLIHTHYDQIGKIVVIHLSSGTKNYSTTSNTDVLLDLPLKANSGNLNFECPVNNSYNTATGLFTLVTPEGATTTKLVGVIFKDGERQGGNWTAAFSYTYVCA